MRHRSSNVMRWTPMKDGELRRSRKHDIICDTVDIAVVVVSIETDYRHVYIMTYVI